MKNKKNNQEKSRLEDVIKAMRRGNREGQQEVLGPGFHSTNRVHRFKKTYSRKEKHKGGGFLSVGENDYICGGIDIL